MLTPRQEIKSRLQQALVANLTRIKELSGAKNNAELAKFLGVHKGTLDFWMYSNSEPKVSILMEVAARLGVTVSQLIGETEITDAEWEDVCQKQSA